MIKHCQWDGKEEYNRQLVLKFYQKAFGDLEFQSAADEYLSPAYIQHNPEVADGIPAFLEFVKPAFEGASKTQVDIRASAAEADLVWLHLRLVVQGVPLAVIEIFRVSCTRITEHWDVVQPIGNGPYANSHPFF